MAIGSQARSCEVQGGLTVHVSKNIATTGNDRYLDSAFDCSDTELHLDLSGGYVGMTVRC